MYGGDAQCPLPRKRARLAMGSAGMPPLTPELPVPLTPSCPQPDVEHAIDPTVVLTTTGHVLAANARAASLLGYARDELLGSPLAVDPHDRGVLRVDLAGARARVVLRHRSGRRVEVDALLAYDDSGAIVATLRPRTSSAQTTMAPIAGVVKHQLLLIASDVGLLHQRLPAYASSELQRALVRLEQNVYAIDRQVSEVLDLTHIDAGRLELVREPVDVPQLVTTVVDRTVPVHDRFRAVVHREAQVVVHADVARLERVLANLVHRALEVTPSPNEIFIEVDPYPDAVRVSVIDGGPPMSAVAVERAFDRDSLGLYVSRKILEAHGGRLDVITSTRPGARFFLELPVG